MGRKKIKPVPFSEEKKQYLKQYRQNLAFSNKHISDNEINNDGSISKRKLMDFKSNINNLYDSNISKLMTQLEISSAFIRFE